MQLATSPPKFLCRVTGREKHSGYKRNSLRLRRKHLLPLHEHYKLWAVELFTATCDVRFLSLLVRDTRFLLLLVRDTRFLLLLVRDTRFLLLLVCDMRFLLLNVRDTRFLLQLVCDMRFLLLNVCDEVPIATCAPYEVSIASCV